MFDRYSGCQIVFNTEAVSVFIDGVGQLVELLEKFANDSTTTSDTRLDTKSETTNTLNFNYITLVQFQQEILRKIDRVQLRSQDPKMNSKILNHMRLSVQKFDTRSVKMEQKSLSPFVKNEVLIQQFVLENDEKCPQNWLEMLAFPQKVKFLAVRKAYLIVCSKK